MKAATRFFSIILALAVVCGLLSGCGEGAPGAEVTPTSDPNATVWVPSFKDMPEEIDYFNSSTVHDGYVYIGTTARRTIVLDTPSALDPDSTTTVISEGGVEYVPVIYKLAADGSSAEELPDYAPSVLPEGRQGSVSINALTVDDEGNVWVCEDVYMYHYELNGKVTDDGESGEYFSDGRLSLLRKLSPTGAELLSVDLSALANESEYFYLDELVCDGEGNVYFNTQEGEIHAYDKNGALAFTLGGLDWVRSLVRLGDGRIAAGTYGMNGFELKPVDAKAKGWGKTIAASNAEAMFNGSGGYAFLYTVSTDLYGWDADKGEGVEILDWLDCDMNQDGIRAVEFREDGTMLCVCSGTDVTAGTLVTLTETPASEVVQKTTLSFACMYLDSNARAQILKFNRENPEYRIEVTDYSQFNTQEDYSAGLTKLNTEMIGGNVPDIIDVAALPVRQYASKGLLTDLYPLIDADPELSRDSFVQSILKALEIDGKLYHAASDFGVMSIIGRRDIVGEGGWTLDEMMECYAEQPEGTRLFQLGITQPDMLQFMCYMNLDRFVDWESGKCSFDSEEFKDILEFCSQFPADFDYSEGYDETGDIRSGKQLLSITAEYDFNSFQMYEAMYGGELVYKGFPTNSGSGNVATTNSSTFAISESCAHKDAAWSFVRTFLTEEYQERNVWNFPTNQAAFDAQLAEAMEVEYYTDENGNQVEQSKGGMGVDGFMVELYAVTPAQAERMLALIDSVDGLMNMDDGIFNIMKEDAAAYFSGSKTVEDTIKTIQSKVNIYVNEQR